MGLSGWVGVDLDATLAYYEGHVPGTIGAPVPAMLQKVREHLDRGDTVKIFTARGSYPEEVALIQKWLVDVCKLPALEVTATKDYAMIALYDDRAFHIVPNTGVGCCENTSNALRQTISELDHALMRIVVLESLLGFYTQPPLPGMPQ